MGFNKNVENFVMYSSCTRDTDSSNENVQYIVRNRRVYKEFNNNVRHFLKHIYAPEYLTILQVASKVLTVFARRYTSMEINSGYFGF